MTKPIQVDLEVTKEMIHLIEEELELAKRVLTSEGKVDFETFLRSARFLHSASRLTDMPARW